MNNKEALECVNKELKIYNEDLLTNIHDEIVSNGVYFGSSFSIAYLVHLLSDRIDFNQMILPALIIPIVITIKNHSLYSRDINTKNNIRFLKRIKKDIIQGYNPFENIEKDDFSKELELKYNYKNTLI